MEATTTGADYRDSLRKVKRSSAMKEIISYFSIIWKLEPIGTTLNSGRSGNF